MTPREDKLRRFMEHVTKTETCWLYNGTKNTKGYGTFWNGERTVFAHRYAYNNFIGDVPNGLFLDHLCRIRNCVNPEHLEAVAMKENVLRGFGPTAFHARKKECKYGHPFSGENLILKPIKHGVQRVCRICRKGGEMIEKIALWFVFIGILLLTLGAVIWLLNSIGDKLHP